MARTPVPVSPDVADPLRSLRLVKWLTRLFVYPGVTLLMPLDHFLTGLTWEQAISVHLGGYVIATCPKASVEDTDVAIQAAR